MGSPKKRSEEIKLKHQAEKYKIVCENLTTSAMRKLSREDRKTEIENSFSLMDKDGSNSVSVDEIVKFMLLKGKFDLGTKNQRDFSASVLRKLGNEHMNKDEFVQFWMVFYDKFFKIDTNKDQFISVMEVINYFCAHDMEHFKKAGEYVKGSDLNLDGKVSVLEFFLSFHDLDSLLEEDL